MCHALGRCPSLLFVSARLPVWQVGLYEFTTAFYLQLLSHKWQQDKNMHEHAFATSIRIPTVVIFFGPRLQRFQQELPRA